MIVEAYMASKVDFYLTWGVAGWMQPGPILTTMAKGLTLYH